MTELEFSDAASGEDVVVSMKTQQQSQPFVKVIQTEDKLITRKMASERLCVSTRTIDRMVEKGWLEKVFVGAAPRFRKHDIDKIVEQGV